VLTTIPGNVFESVAGDQERSLSSHRFARKRYPPLVISTGAKRSGETSVLMTIAGNVFESVAGDQERSHLATALHGSATLPLVISTGAKRSGETSVLMTIPGNVFESVAGDEERSLSSHRFARKRYPALCHLDRSVAKRRDLCVDDHSWKCFSICTHRRRRRKL
jgi:hypothetical protein